MPITPQCESCGSTNPTGGRTSFPDVGLVCLTCAARRAPTLDPDQLLSHSLHDKLQLKLYEKKAEGVSLPALAAAKG